MKTTLHHILGSLMALVGFLFFVGSLIALVDPVGTQMGDDSNPFGPPPSGYASLTGVLLGALMGAGGIWLIRRTERGGGRAV